MRYLVVYRELYTPSHAVLADVIFKPTDGEAREVARRLPRRIADVHDHAVTRHEVLHLLRERKEGSDEFVEVPLKGESGDADPLHGEREVGVH